MRAYVNAAMHVYTICLMHPHPGAFCVRIRMHFIALNNVSEMCQFEQLCMLKYLCMHACVNTAMHD